MLPSRESVESVYIAARGIWYIPLAGSVLSTVVTDSPVRHKERKGLVIFLLCIVITVVFLFLSGYYLNEYLQSPSRVSDADDKSRLTPRRDSRVVGIAAAIIGTAVPTVASGVLEILSPRAAAFLTGAAAAALFKCVDSLYQGSAASKMSPERTVD